MRVMWLAALLVAVGCRSGPEPISEFRGRGAAATAEEPSSTAQITSGRSDIMPVAFSADMRKDVLEQDGLSVPGAWSVASGAGPGLSGESVPPVLSLTLEGALETALARNPDLVAARSREPVAHAAYHVAGTYPFNPQFQTQIAPYTHERSGEDAAVSQQHVLVQTFELAHQRQFRTRAAAADCDRVRGEIRAVELATATETERLFFTALYQRDLRDLVRTLAKLNENLVGVLQRRWKAGQANHADVVLARLQAQSTRRRQRLMEANYRTTLLNLLNYLGLEQQIEVKLGDPWLTWQWRSATDALNDADQALVSEENSDVAETTDQLVIEPILRRLIAARPDVAAAYAAVAVARQNLALADAMRTPDLQIGPMWQRDDAATEFWGVQAQMDIPIVNTGKPLVRQRLAELRQQQVTAARLEQKAILEATAAVRRYERARRLVQQTRSDLAQAIPDVMRPFEQQFLAGQITLLQVLAARTSVAESRQSFLELLNELAQAAADMTRTTGLPARQLFLVTAPASNQTQSVPTP